MLSWEHFITWSQGQVKFGRYRQIKHNEESEPGSTFSNNLISHGNGINLRPTAQTGHTTLTFSVQLFIAKAEWRRWWTTTNEGRSELTKGWEEDDDDDGDGDLSSCALRFLAGSSLALFIALRMRRKRWIHSQLGNTLLDCS